MGSRVVFWMKGWMVCAKRKQCVRHWSIVALSNYGVQNVQLNALWKNLLVIKGHHTCISDGWWWGGRGD